jgi:HD domain-containing protein
MGGIVILKVNNRNLVDWAYEQSSSLLPPLRNRWLHVQGVAERSRHVGRIFDEDGQAYLIASAYLHDIGYAPSLQQTGFHPIDGARYLQSHHQNRLASLTAYHSGAQFEASLRGLSAQLELFTCEVSLIADALTYCDLTTSSTGEHISFQERLDDIFRRYDESHIVSQAIRQAVPYLSGIVERVRNELHKQGMIDAKV